jgi:hypothetical protein
VNQDFHVQARGSINLNHFVHTNTNVGGESMYDPKTAQDWEDAELDTERQAIESCDLPAAEEWDLLGIGGPDPNADHNLMRLAGGP